MKIVVVVLVSNGRVPNNSVYHGNRNNTGTSHMGANQGGR